MSIKIMEDNLLCIIVVRKKGREFEAKRYNTTDIVREPQEYKIGKLKEVRQWIKDNYPDIVQFPKDKNDPPDLYETWC